LTRVHRKPGPHVYWGYRPPPRLPNAVAWERTEAVEQALDRVLADPDRAVRLAVLRRMQREKVPTRLATLRRWLHEEKEAEPIAAILESLREHPAGPTRELLATVAAARDKPSPSRLKALALFSAGLEDASGEKLLALAGSVEDGPVLAEAIRQLGQWPRLPSSELLLGRLSSAEPAVRATAIETLAEVSVAGGERKVPAEVLRKLLDDKDAQVRRAAASAAGKVGLRSAIPPLLTLARDSEPAVQRASLESLRRLKEPRAVPLAVAALGNPETQGAALRCLADLGGPDQVHAVAELSRRHPSTQVLPLALRMLTDWGRQGGAKRIEMDRIVAELQGSSGVLGRWHVAGSLPATAAPQVIERWAALAGDSTEPQPRIPAWRIAFGAGTEYRVPLGPVAGAERNALWLAYSDVRVSERTAVQFLAGSNAALRIWVNGRPVHQGGAARPFQPDAERFEAVLEKGWNRVFVQVSDPQGDAEFHLRLRPKRSIAEQEQLTQAALTRPGSAERGRALFLDAQKSQCLLCHRLGEQGERIGPELTGVGDRFSRIHLIESILEPSRTIAPSYQTVVVALKDGRVLTGLKVAETESLLTLADNQGKKHPIAKSDIDDQRSSPLSTMPEGLAKRLTPEEFVDLIAFLASQKERQGQGEKK
jgi:putative heme-binding domain-containing protein